MIRCEYFLVQYVPFPREELRLPIGLVLLEDGGRLVRHAMTHDWRAVRFLDPHVDLTLLQSLPELLERTVEEHQAMDTVSGGSKLRQDLCRMAETNFGTVQIARPRGVETEDPALEFGRLFDEHVASRRAPVPRTAPRAGSRLWIRSQLRRALESSPIWPHLRTKVPVEEFTAPGDRFQIDISYQPNGATKYLHAISLEHDWNQAKVLSYTFSKIRARNPATLTAIVAGENPRLPAALGCRRILLDAGITVHPITALSSLVDQIQRELGSVS